jgi:hypothetical protein
MSNTVFPKLLFATLLLGASAAQAAYPTSVSEVPRSWYADEIRTAEPATGAAHPVFPSAAYEHGPNGHRYAEAEPTRTQPSLAGSAAPFPSSPNESGSVL